MSRSSSSRPIRVALAFVALLLAGCGSTPEPEPYEPGVRAEVALEDGVVQPPVFRWDSPVAARVTVRRGGTVIWDVAEGDQAGPSGGVRRGPIPMPLTYGQAWYNATGPAPRTIVSAQPLLPQRAYTIAVIGYDGQTFGGRFNVQERVEPLPYR